jgi:hypothetical protein
VWKNQAHAFGAPRQRPNPAGEPGQRLRRDPTARFGPTGEAEAEKLARTGARHRALRRVNLHFETAVQEAFDTRHHPRAGSARRCCLGTLDSGLAGCARAPE